MRTALLAALCLSLAGCWKTIHEASAPGVGPDRPQLATADRPSR